MSDTEKNSVVTGFYKYDTRKFRDFTPEHLSMLERIVLKYRNKEPLSLLMKFYPQLEQHLNDTNPHDFQVAPFAQELLDQLYTIYQQQGYTGSVTDMLEAILKNISIANVDTIFHTASRYEAINAPGWKKLMDAHKEKQYAHDDIFESFKIHGEMFFFEPVWMFTYLFSELYLPYKEDGYTLSSWNSQEGSLFFEGIFQDFSKKTVLFDIRGLESTFRVAIETEEQACIGLFHNDECIVRVPIQTQVRPFLERMVFSYDNTARTFLWRTSLYKGEIPYTFPEGISLMVHVPFQEYCSDEAAVLRTIQYYSNKMTLDNMPILL